MTQDNILSGSHQEHIKEDLFKSMEKHRLDLKGFKMLSELMKSKSFQEIKLDLFGAAEDESVFQSIEAYYLDGKPGDLPEKEQVYLDLLRICDSLDHQYGKRRTIRILVSKPYSLSYNNANTIYAHALEMFHSDRNYTRDAMRNHIADQLDSLYHATVSSASTPKDYAMAAEILEKKYKLLGLDQPDPEVFETQEYIKPVRLLSLTPEAVGLPAADRDQLAAQIDSLESVSAADKERLRMEAGVERMDLPKLMENVAQEEN